jgi:hypothetical protein
MHFPSLKSVLLALALLGLVVPTGAALTTGGTDEPFDGNDVVLAPYDGPNGEYAVEDGGKFSVDLSATGAKGVNNNSSTVIERVFVIQNKGDEDVDVNVTHNAGESVTLYNSTSGEPIDTSGPSNMKDLGSGEEINVSIEVDTRSSKTAVGDTLLSEITLHVRQLDAEQTGQAGGGQDAPIVPPENVTGIQAEFDASDTVVDETGTDDAGPTEDEEFTIEELDPDSIPEVPNPGSEPQPNAVITDSDTTLTGTNDEAIDIEGIDKVTTTNEQVTLDGHSSTITRTSGVQIDRRIVRAADITPPAGRENQPGTVRMAVPRDQLLAAPEDAQMGHLTENGWELLETEVVAQNADTVVYEAETSSFSPFAVFDGPNVEYEWTLPDGSTVEGPDVRSSFAEPGFYNVTLTVTDALGNSDTAEYRILVNDEPDVTIETDGPVVAGQETTLRANVTDEVGNVTVTWQLPNGREVEGRTVNHTFTNGTFDVSATAEDEFGATGTAQTTITTDSESPLVVSAGSFPLLTLLLSTGFLVLVAAMLLWLRRFGLPALPKWITIPTRDGKHPQITAFEDPSWDPRRGRFEIGQLRVEDVKEDLETVEIGIQTSDGTEVARKTIDFDGTDAYEVSSLLISSASSEYVDPTRKYDARIRAVDAAGNEDTAVSTVRFVRAVRSQPTQQYGVSAD